MKKFFASVLIVLCFIFNVSTVYAQYGQYGGPSPSLSILINKMVARTSTNKGGQTICDSSLTFQNNFSPSDPRFVPSDFICFELKVLNTSNTTLTGVTVEDFVPSDVEPISGSGSFNNNSRTITINAGDFAQGQEQDYFFLMQVHNQSQLPQDKGLFCEINRGQAFNANVSDDSSSQFCIEKQVQGVTTTPSAGPEMGALLLSGEVFVLGLGVFLKRKAV